MGGRKISVKQTVSNNIAAIYKYVSYKKKYTIVFIESENEITICEFISSKLISLVN